MWTLKCLLLIEHKSDSRIGLCNAFCERLFLCSSWDAGLLWSEVMWQWAQPHSDGRCCEELLPGSRESPVALCSLWEGSDQQRVPYWGRQVGRVQPTLINYNSEGHCKGNGESLSSPMHFKNFAVNTRTHVVSNYFDYRGVMTISCFRPGQRVCLNQNCYYNKSETNLCNSETGSLNCISWTFFCI